jgi:hypothetical protein
MLLANQTYRGRIWHGVAGHIVRVAGSASPCPRAAGPSARPVTQRRSSVKNVLREAAERIANATRIGLEIARKLPYQVGLTATVRCWHVRAVGEKTLMSRRAPVLSRARLDPPWIPLISE